MFIIFHVIAQIFITLELVYGDCGIPGVPAFGRIRVVSDTDFTNMTSFPEGYAIKYDCFSDGQNFVRDTNGVDLRVCNNSVWEPWQMPNCRIDDPDDGTNPFVIDITQQNNTLLNNGLYKNEWLLFDNKKLYNNKIKDSLAVNVSTGSYLWRIKFTRDYPVEKDHSFLVVMQFVIQYSKSFNYSDIILDAMSSFSSSNRSCKRKIEVDYVHKLFTDKFDKQNLDIKDHFYKITLECRDNWDERPLRWYKTSKIEIFRDLNITITVNASINENIELLLTQLIVDADCGYPDLPENGFYTKDWMNAIFSCTNGKVIGQTNVSCNYDGRYSSKVPICCVGEQCNDRIVVNEAKPINGINIIIIVLSVFVILLIVVVLALYLRSRKVQRLANLERAKQEEMNMEKYDDICDDYEQIANQEYAEVNYMMVDKTHLEMYDDSGCVSTNVTDSNGRYTRRMEVVDLSKDGDYVKMATFDDYLNMNANSNV